MTTDRRWVAGAPPGCVASGPEGMQGGPGGAAGPECPLRSCKPRRGCEVIPGPRGGVPPES